MMMLTAQIATAFAADLNVFSSGEVADPSAVNANFDTLMRLARNQQHQGSFYRINCSNDNNALLDAVSQGETLIEVEAGPCLANMGRVGDGPPIVGDLYIKGVGAQKPRIYTTDDADGAQYLGGKNGSIIIENVSFEGSIVSMDSAASFTARDSDIRCQDDKTQAKIRGYQIAVYLNGGTGALARSTVTNCRGPAILLDSGAHLNATDSIIEVPAAASDLSFPQGFTLRSASSAVVDRTTIGGTGSSHQGEIPIYVENADITLRQSTIKGTAVVDRASTFTVRGSNYRWPDSDSINVVVVTNDSSFFGIDSQFERTTIKNSFGATWDPSSKIYLISNNTLTHSKLTLIAGSDKLSCQSRGL